MTYCLTTRSFVVTLNNMLRCVFRCLLATSFIQPQCGDRSDPDSVAMTVVLISVPVFASCMSAIF